MIVSCPNQLARILRSWGKQWAYDTETRASIPVGCVSIKKKDTLILDRTRLLVFSASGRRADGTQESVSVFVKEHYPIKDAMPLSSLLKVLHEFMEDPEVMKIAHHANYDDNVMRNHGIVPVNVTCTLIMGKCWNENLPAGLKERAPLVNKMLRKTKTIDFKDVMQTSAYAEDDAVTTYLLWELYLASEGFLPANHAIYEHLERPVLTHIERMERTGMLVDKNYFAKMAKAMFAEKTALEKAIYRQAGVVINLNSSQQLCKLLYGQLKLPAPPLKSAKSKNPSTDEKALTALVVHHPIVKMILEYKHLAKLYDTYVNPDTGICAYADDKGRIHGTTHQYGADTSRMSASLPNLQQVPRRSKHGAAIRRGFVAPPGCKFMNADFSMFELVMLANFSRDPAMCKALADPKGDLHTQTANLVGVTRDVAKTLNFGITYGMGAKKLRETLAMLGIYISEDEARKYRTGFFSAYAGIKIHENKLLAFARQSGYIHYLSGRIRSFPEINSADGGIRASAERKVLNSEIQGSCADWMKYSFVRMCEDKKLKNLGFEPVALVHDEVCAYIPHRSRGFGATRQALNRLFEIMKQPVGNPIIKLVVPIRVSGGLGDNWQSAK